MKRIVFGIYILIGSLGCSEKLEQLPERSAIQFSGSIIQAVSQPETNLQKTDGHNRKLPTVTTSEASANNELSLYITYEGDSPSTRTSMSGSTASFASGDKIGISETTSGRNNVQFAYNGTSWSTSTPMYWYNGTSMHTFYAYYPYNASNSGNLVTIPLLTGQSFGSTPDPNCDMLVANPPSLTRPSNNSIALTFTHAFSLLQFTITSPLINLYTLKSLTIKGGNSSGASPYGIVNSTNAIAQIWYDPPTKTIQAVSNTSSVYAQSVAQNIASPGIIGTISITVYAIILPGTYANPVPSIQFTLSPLLLGSDKLTQPANLPNTQFLPGTKYAYAVSIRN